MKENHHGKTTRSNGTGPEARRLQPCHPTYLFALRTRVCSLPHALPRCNGRGGDPRLSDAPHRTEMFTRNLSPSLGRTKVPLHGDIAPTDRGRAIAVSAETAAFAAGHQRNRSQRTAGIGDEHEIPSRADDHVWRRIAHRRSLPVAAGDYRLQAHAHSRARKGRPRALHAPPAALAGIPTRVLAPASTQRMALSSSVQAGTCQSQFRAEGISKGAHRRSHPQASVAPLVAPRLRHPFAGDRRRY